MSFTLGNLTVPQGWPEPTGPKELGFTVKAMSKLLVLLQDDSLHLIFI